MVYFLAGRRKCPDWLRVPPNLLFSGYWGKVVGGTKLTIFPPSSAAVKNDWSYISSTHVSSGHVQGQLYVSGLDFTFIPADRLHAQKGHCCHILMRPHPW